MKSKLLIVDDSVLIQTFLSDLFAADPLIEVIGTAADPYQARDIMRQNWPDIITLDIEMPKMSGIEFLKKIMHSRPTPVVMFSTLTKKGASVTMEALALGAFDYIPKPGQYSVDALVKIRQEITQKVHEAVNANIRRKGVFSKDAPLAPTRVVDGARLAQKVVVIGSSTGGVQALSTILARLNPHIPGIAIVQHMPAAFVDPLITQLGKKTALRVSVADHDQAVLPGQVLIAPGEHHLEIARQDERFKTRLVKGPPIGFHLPAVNALFASAAAIGGDAILGIILTGMGDDGASGMQAMHRQGCLTIGQDEETCVVYGMPRKAFELGGVGRQVALDDIAQCIVEFAGSD